MMNDIYEPEFVKKLFNNMSGSYERMNYITSFGCCILWRKQFLSKLGKSDRPLRVMDLLSGLGENWVFLKKRFPNADFYALDFSEQMIQQSMHKAKQLFGEKMQVMCADVLNSKLPSEHFDIVSCAYGLKTFNEDQLSKLAKELARILKAQGTFSFVEVSKPKNKGLLFWYKIYLAKIIPLLGKILLGNPSDYRMLWVYTDKFGNSKTVQEIFEQHGLIVKYDTYLWGCASGISGQKIAAADE